MVRSFAQGGPGRLLDLALVLSLAAIALQLLPLPQSLRSRFAPAAIDFEQAVLLAAPQRDRPVSVDPGATLLALVAAASIVLLFWSVRAMFERGALRATVRSLAWIGLVVSPLAMLHHMLPLPLLDLSWGPTARGLRPFGPFVNRNDFAGWLIMAIPLVLGYGMARLQARHRPEQPFDPEVAFDRTSIWLASAVCLMLAGLLTSMSRSGLLGAGAAALLFASCSRQRISARRAGWYAVTLGALFGIAAMYADMAALGQRLEGSLSDGLAGRLGIWRQTLPVVRDFWPSGSGVGTYQMVMPFYQTMSRQFYITHADNELLQILAEGGLLLAAPVAVVLVAAVWLVVKRLRDDVTPIFWVRLGAAAGMIALVSQNMVEMTLRVPANAVLFAILAAMATHES
jgi:O-antigen ligase